MMMTISSSPAMRREPADRLDAPFVSRDLPFEIARLRSEHAYEAEGHAGRTLTKYSDLRVVLEAMKDGVRLPCHQTAGRMTLQVIFGQLRVWVRYGENVDLSEGSLAAIDAGSIHEIESLQECAFLLTLAWPPGAHDAGETEAAKS